MTVKNDGLYVYFGICNIIVSHLVLLGNTSDIATHMGRIHRRHGKNIHIDNLRSNGYI